MAAVVSQKQTCIDSGKSESASSTVSGSKLEGQASASRDAICDSFGKVHVASRQNKDCVVVATAECRPIINGVPNEVTVCKCCRPGTMQDGGQITSNPGTEAGDLDKAGCVASTRRRCCEAALTSSCRPASSDAQAVCEGAGANTTRVTNPVNVLHGGGSKVYLNATFDNFISFRDKALMSGVGRASTLSQ